MIGVNLMNQHDDLVALIKTNRDHINNIDNEILALIKKREDLSINIGRAKAKLGIPTRDFHREKEVFLLTKDRAEKLGIPISFALSLQKLILKNSLSSQEQDHLKQHQEDDHKSILVIGGAGRLGSWLCHFISDIGHKLTVMDIIKPKFPCTYINNLDASVTNFDIIIIATPIRVSIDIINILINLNIKKPIVFDVASVKTPVYTALLKLKHSGVLVTSLHPMFGPSVELLFGKHIIRCSLGCKEADDAAMQLFSLTSLTLVDMSINEHDNMIALLLGLTHVLNIAFITALSKSGYDINELSRLSSPTFAHLLAIASKVMDENPHLYYEIQALNPYSIKVYEYLTTSLKDITKESKSMNEEGFVSIMTKAKDFLKGSSS